MKAQTMSFALDTTTILPMLTYGRPAGSKAECEFIKEFLAPLGLQSDAAGNLHKRIGDVPVLWSCHTDTVHSAGGKQWITYGDGTVTLHPISRSNCLGADDTAGVWLMREMILAERPGLYVFHRGEECGGIGSDFIARDTPQLLDGIECAIALDRAGTTDVITHQAGGRCCSGAFALSLAKLLPAGFKPSDCGVFTDTANYTHLVPECTNLSVGYYGQHTRTERLDVRFLFRLRDALLSLDARDLTISRDHRAPDMTDARFGHQWHRYPAYPGEFADDEVLRLAELCRLYPHEVAELLNEHGITAEDVHDQIRFSRF